MKNSLDRSIGFIFPFLTRNKIRLWKNDSQSHVHVELFLFSWIDSCLLFSNRKIVQLNFSSISKDAKLDHFKLGLNATLDLKNRNKIILANWKIRKSKNSLVIFHLTLFFTNNVSQGEPLWLSGKVVKNEKTNEIKRTWVCSPPRATSF
jgi:hypothetical protein